MNPGCDWNLMPELLGTIHIHTYTHTLTCKILFYYNIKFEPFTAYINIFRKCRK